MDSINAPIHYSFLSGNPPNYRDFFEINPNTGAVKQIRAVDTTVTKKFDIIIKVRTIREDTRLKTLMRKRSCTFAREQVFSLLSCLLLNGKK
jgi:protocadherin-15